MNSGKILLECGFHPFEDESSIQHGITENHEVHRMQSVQEIEEKWPRITNCTRGTNEVPKPFLFPKYD